MLNILQALFTKMELLANFNKSLYFPLLPTILLMRGKVNFTNMSHYTP
jgi:hypothetical protein